MLRSLDHRANASAIHRMAALDPSTAAGQASAMIGGRTEIVPNRVPALVRPGAAAGAVRRSEAVEAAATSIRRSPAGAARPAATAAPTGATPAVAGSVATGAANSATGSPAVSTSTLSTSEPGTSTPGTSPSAAATKAGSVTGVSSATTSGSTTSAGAVPATPAASFAAGPTAQGAVGDTGTRPVAAGIHRTPAGSTAAAVWSDDYRPADRFGAGSVSIARSHVALRRSSLPVSGSAASAAEHQHGSAEAGSSWSSAFPVASAFGLPTRQSVGNTLRRSTSTAGQITPRRTDHAVRPLAATAGRTAGTGSPTAASTRSAASGRPNPSGPGSTGPASTGPGNPNVRRTPAGQQGGGVPTSAAGPALPGVVGWNANGLVSESAPAAGPFGPTLAGARATDTTAGGSSIRRSEVPGTVRPPASAPIAGSTAPGNDEAGSDGSVGPASRAVGSGSLPGGTSIQSGAPDVAGVANPYAPTGFTPAGRFAANAITPGQVTFNGTPRVAPVGTGGSVRRQFTPSTGPLMSRAGVAPPRGTPGRTPVEDGPATPISARGADPVGSPAAASSGAAVVRRTPSLVDRVPASAFARAVSTAPTGAVSSLGRSQGATIRRALEESPVSETSYNAPGQSGMPDNLTDHFSPEDWDRIVLRVVAKVEEKVSDDLMRRGRRFDSDMF